jgi:hypothetical protein
MIPPLQPYNPAPSQQAPQAGRMVTTINGLLEGRHNAIGTATLAVSTTMTQITDARVGINSVMPLVPTTARAAASIASVYISAKLQGAFIITHDSQTYTDRVYSYTVGGA